MNCKDVKASIDTASRRNPLALEAHAHLNGCPDCRGYSDQSSALMVLLTAQPRVEAPADFDFRLRARIARTQSEPAGSFGFLENFFGQTFSLKQAAASLAALAVMAAGTTLYFTQSNQPAQSVNIANNQPSVNRTVETPKSVVEPIAPVSAAPVKLSQSSGVRTAVLTNAAAKPMTVASNTDLTGVYNRQKGVLIAANNSSVVYGAEKSVSANKSQEFIPSL